MENTPSAPVSRAERVLAAIAAIVASLGFLALMIVLAAPLFGVTGDSWTQQPWPALVLLAYFGLPAGFCFVVAVIIVRAIASRRAAGRG